MTGSESILKYHISVGQDRTKQTRIKCYIIRLSIVLVINIIDDLPFLDLGDIERTVTNYSVI